MGQGDHAIDARPLSFSETLPGATLLEPIEPESGLLRWARRSVTFSTFAFVWLTGVLLAPLWLPALIVLDGLGRGRWALIRAAVFFLWFATCEVLGLAAAFGLWVKKLVTRMDAEAWMDANARVQARWVRALFGGLVRLFRITVDADVDPGLISGPAFVLVRHASTADTLLPGVTVGTLAGLRLRYVLKRELLWDPCLDVIGQRLPNCFVARGTRDPAQQAARVAELARDLGPREGVLLFPEGTRWTPAKRERGLERLAGSGERRRADLYRDRAHVMPPRARGFAALVDANPDASLLVLAHHGFEGITTLRHLVDGSFLGRHVGLKLWRIPACELGRDERARIEVLDRVWGEVDSFVRDASRARVP